MKNVHLINRFSRKAAQAQTLIFWHAHLSGMNAKITITEQATESATSLTFTRVPRASTGAQPVRLLSLLSRQVW